MKPALSQNHSRKITGLAVILAGILMLAAACLLTGYNLRESQEAEKRAATAAGILREQTARNVEAAKTEQDLQAGFSDQVLMAEDTAYREMPTEKIDGRLYIGVLDVPELSVSLPVMYSWNEKRLKISPCRYSGSYFSDDLVICGHNYRSHFSPLKSAVPGTKVILTAVDGTRIEYEVSAVETLRSTDIEKMITNSNNSTSNEDWDLTLFTCTTGGRARLALRCRRART